MKYKFEIKIFDSRKMFFDTDDEYLQRKTDIIVDIMIFDNDGAKHNLEQYWNMLFGQYEGMNYCIVDLLNNNVIISGTFDPNDIDVIEDYDSL